MNKRLIGVDVDDFRLPPKEALRKAAELSFRAVELATVEGDMAPGHLSASGRRHLSRYVSGLGLHLAALVADMPGSRLTDPGTVQERVERTCQVLELAAELRVSTVTASAGALTHPRTGEPSETAVEALTRIGEFADSRGVLYALRPAYDSGERIARVLEALRCPSIRVCLDPAALVMTGSNPLASIDPFVDQISLVHARDGTAGLSERSGEETRLGEGDVDLVGVLAVLDAAGFAGPYILRRRDSQNPIADLRSGLDVLRRLLPAD